MGIVHRDLKPLNIMLNDGAEGLVQLVDFGLAKVPVDALHVRDAEGRSSLTQAGVIFGTVAYIAPEAALGMRNVEKRSDLYALGVILYEMLAGKHPFTATEPAALFAQQRREIPPPFKVRAPEVTVPPELEALVQRLLDKDPDNRYPHARALMVALDAVIKQMEAGAAAPMQPARAPSWKLFWGVAVVIAAALAAVGWLVLAKLR
jgi:serine/threonine-protein kinase